MNNIILKTKKCEENELIRVMRKDINTVTFNIPEVMVVEYNGKTCMMTPCSTYNFSFKTNKGKFVLGYEGTYEQWKENYEYVSSEMYLIYDDGKIIVIGEDGTDYGFMVDADFLYETNRPKI